MARGLGLLVLCSLLGWVAPPPSPAAAPVVVRYADYHVYDPVYVALDRGLFHQWGVEVRLMGDVLAGPPALQAVAGGSADAALSSVPAILNARAAGLPVVAVSDVQSALPGQPMETYFVRADSPIQTVAEVRGHRWAVNLWKSSFHYTALWALAAAHVPEDQVHFLLLGFSEQILALQRGDVDVIGLIEPWATYARTRYAGRVRILTTAYQLFGAKEISLHFFNAGFVAAHPEVVRRWVGAVGDAADWTAAHPADAAAIISRYTKIAPTDIGAVRFQPHARVAVQDCAWWQDYLLKRGDLAARLPVEQVCTNAYNPHEAHP